MRCEKEFTCMNEEGEGDTVFVVVQKIPVSNLT
jgi:hypothetical protein